MRGLWSLVACALVACGGQSKDDFNDPAGSSGTGAAGSGASGGAGGSGGSKGGTGGATSGTGGTTGDTGGSGGSKGGTGGTTGGAGGASGGSSGTSGSGTGGASGSAGATGGAGGSLSGSGGTNAGVGGDMACCTAAAVCGDGAHEIPSLDDCPPGARCYELSICCSTIYCATGDAQCDAIPTCDEGDKEVEQCPEEVGVTCYERTLCGTTITCRDDTCDPENEPYRSYVGKSEQQCMLIDFACPDETQYFYNTCGCGCEQDRDCPESINCQPGPDPQETECTDEQLKHCPYSAILE